MIAVRAVPVAIGLSAVIGQILFMREVMACFNGNELSLGMVLAAWLFWTAAGSGLTRMAHMPGARLPLAIGLAAALCGISLAPTIVLLRSARALLQAAPGELFGPGVIALVCVACLSVFCVLSGCLFTLAAQLYRQSSGPGAGTMAPSYAYFFETGGSALGGVLTSVLLLRCFSSLQIAMLVALLQSCVAWLLILDSRRWRVLCLVCSAAAAGALMAGVAPRLETSTQQRMWGGFQLIAFRDSVFGRLSVLGTGATRSIYENGGNVANIPDPANAEETVHFALLEHPAPRRILLIGGGLNGSIAEALKHPAVERVDYLELDPAMLAMARGHIPSASALALDDPRVRIHSVDGRFYLHSTAEMFDAILLSVPDPDNAQLNRFYTTEFFRTVRSHLAPGGIVALALRSSEESIGPDLAAFLRCIDKTVAKEFPATAVIPGATLHIFAAIEPGTLTEDPQVLIARLRSRNIATLYVREYFLPFRMAPDRMAQIHEILTPHRDTPINRDFHPVAYYFAAILWAAQFKSVDAHAMKSGAQLRFPKLLAGTLLLSLAAGLFWLVVLRRSARAAAAWGVLATGYTLMALQILLLLSFQSAYGYVFREVTVLIGAFMAGIAMGSALGIAVARSGDLKACMRRAALNQFVLAACAPLLLCVVTLTANVATGAGQSLMALAGFPLLAFLCGLPGGYQFPIATAIYQHGRSGQTSLGTLYALDLVGGCLGAALLSGLLIPVFGFWNNAWLTAIVSAAPAAFIPLAARLRG